MRGTALTDARDMPAANSQGFITASIYSAAKGRAPTPPIPFTEWQTVHPLDPTGSRPLVVSLVGINRPPRSVWAMPPSDGGASTDAAPATAERTTTLSRWFNVSFPYSRF